MTSQNFFKKCFLLSLMLLIFSAHSYATTTVKGSGEFQGAVSLMIDGAFVEQGSVWDGEGCVSWTEREVFFVMNLGDVVRLQDFVIQIDNNDTYRIDISTDGRTFAKLLQIDAEIGEIMSGMETLSSAQGHEEYAAEIDFEPVVCQFIKIYAVDGDDAFSISEIHALTSAAAVKSQVPELSKIVVRATGAVVNPVSLILDGKWLEKGAEWDSPECVYWLDRETALILDLGAVRSVQDLVVQADNNDTYRIDYSKDGVLFQTLCTIDMNIGEIESGMDIFSSISGQADYQAGMDFAAVQARFLKIYALDGDEMFSLAEMQVIAK